MSDTTLQMKGIIALPLLAAETAHADAVAASAWNGWTPVSPLPEQSPVEQNTDSPEPIEPQGAYGEPAGNSIEAIAVHPEGPLARAELLAPAGGPEAAFAAFHFGADAIYLGLKKFSARAEAENFTLDEVDEITAYAHSFQPRRRVFVTINTLIRQDELPELVEDLAALAEIGVDALIIQDLGVYHLARRYFPGMELHASTQLAVHNRAGAEALKHLGFQRVVLARELTFEEVRDITAASGIETEVFIHGALCYSYSGLCLFSSQTLGRSGNRGKCAYSCRDSYEITGAPATLRDGSPVKRDPAQGFPFSMKDLALPDHVPALRAAGVSCFKVEGRKKSPLYVATTTDYYRKLIDGGLAPEERPSVEADMQTVFSRPWTHLFVQSHRDKEVADRDTVGHRGTPIGKVEAVYSPNCTDARLRFRTARPLERHDGLQIDLPVLGKPFGFAIEHLWTIGRKGERRQVFDAPADSRVEVGLPKDHPALPVGAPVYCSSSQAVKQRYRYARPKPGQHRTLVPVRIEAILTSKELTVIGRAQSRGDGEVAIRHVLAGPFTPAKDPEAMAGVMRATFEKLGQTRFRLEDLIFRNEDGSFVPVSCLNQLRRELVSQMELALKNTFAERVARLRAEVCAPERKPARTTALQWSLKVDRMEFLDAFEDNDLSGIDEVVVDIIRDHPSLLAEKLDHWAGRIGREHIRLALPPLTRGWEEKGLRQKIRQLRTSGWTKWEAANLSAWSYLEQDPDNPNSSTLDLATDWSVYVLNRLAVEALTKLGVGRFALSPEDGLGNMRSLLVEFGPRAVVIVHQDTPQFLAESCAYANLIGGCPGKANCKFESMEMVSSHGERVTALDYHCRTIVLNQGPFCLSHRLDDLARAGAVRLRADFIYRPYDAREVRDRWRQVRAGHAIPGGHAANFDRGIL